MARQDRQGEGGSKVGPEGQEGQADGGPGPEARAGLEAQDLGGIAGFEFPNQSPLFYAEQADRYERQRLIAGYEKRFGARLVVMIDAIFPDSITYFEELLYDADPAEDMHLLLSSPGGDGETAVRLVRSAQDRCGELTVVVPDRAKSAATILALGAHHILMGPTSDLGPVDPQLLADGRHLVSAKDLIAAVEHAERAVTANPDSYPIHASMLADVTEVMLQEARSSLERTEDLVEEALRSCTGRGDREVKRLKAALMKPLIELSKNHSAVFGADDAKAAGLPVLKAEPRGDQWKLVWLLYAKYFALHQRIYEGRRASRLVGPVQG